MVYKIRVILDAKETIFRDIEIKDKQTLWNLHLGIKSAFSLPGEELSSFYFSDDEWNEGRAVPLEDMSDDGDGEIMSDIYLNEGFPEVGAKMRFQYGFIEKNGLKFWMLVMTNMFMFNMEMFFQLMKLRKQIHTEIL